MSKLPLIVGVILGVGVLVYISRPEVSMKLGSRLKCVSRDGRFIDGGYSRIGDDPFRLTVEITDKPEPPSKIIQSGTFLEYKPFKQAFDEACKTGKLRGE